MVSPLTFSHMPRFLGIGDFVLGHEPRAVGPKVSQDLPLVHWPLSLDLEGALGDVMDDAIAGDVVERLGLAHILGRLADDDPSSTSQSVFSEPRGMTRSSSGRRLPRSPS
jgi:hypothetical protein